MKNVKIAVADSDYVFRQELILSFIRFKNYRIVDCVSNGVELISLAKNNFIDIIISYAYLPYISGIEAVKIIRKEKPIINSLIYTTTYQDDVKGLLKENGISNGYCSKRPDVIHEGVNLIQNKKTRFFEPTFLSEKNNDQFDNKDSFFEFKSLRPIDIRIISLVCTGKTNKEIAAVLNLSSRTIDTYCTLIMEKLNLRNKIEIVRFAYINGICTLNCNNFQSGICIKKSYFNK